MSKTFFITGTDTEVGKTAISCALLLAAAQRGLRTAAVKPVAAGCASDGRNEDALQLLEVMSEKLDYEQVNPVALAEPIAPHIAAAREGRRLQVSRLAGLCRGVMLGGADLVLVEGAGGWRVPRSQRARSAKPVSAGRRAGGERHTGDSGPAQRRPAQQRRWSEC